MWVPTTWWWVPTQRQMDDELKIARFGGRNYITFYSVHRLNRVLLIHSFQLRSMSVSARGSPPHELGPAQGFFLLNASFSLPVLLVLGSDSGFLWRRSLLNRLRRTCKLCIESLSSLLCPSIFIFLQQKDDLNGGLKQMENWSASPTWAAMQSVLASVCHMSSVVGSCFICYNIAFSNV